MATVIYIRPVVIQRSQHPDSTPQHYNTLLSLSHTITCTYSYTCPFTVADLHKPSSSPCEMPSSDTCLLALLRREQAQGRHSDDVIIARWIQWQEDDRWRFTGWRCRNHRCPPDWIHQWISEHGKGDKGKGKGKGKDEGKGGGGGSSSSTDAGKGMGKDMGKGMGKNMGKDVGRSRSRSRPMPPWRRPEAMVLPPSPSIPAAPADPADEFETYCKALCRHRIGRAPLPAAPLHYGPADLERCNAVVSEMLQRLAARRAQIDYDEI